MYRISSSLRLLASRAPDGFLREFFSVLLRTAALNDDVVARASYIEGLLGSAPGSIARNPTPHFRAAREALASGASDPIADVLRAKFQKTGESALMVGDRDLGFYDSLIWGARRALDRHQAIRGLSAEDIASSLAIGVSPLTLKWIKYGPNKGVFYYLGTKAQGRPKLTIAGIKSIASKESFNRAMDIVRKTRQEEAWARSLDAPASSSGEAGGPTLGDMLVQEDPISSQHFVDLAARVLQNPEVTRLMNADMLRALKTPAQRAIWHVVRTNPDVLKITSKGIGVSPKELAQQVAEITRAEYKGKSSDVSARKTFLNKVLPAMQQVLSEGPVADLITRKREIMEIIQDATRGTARLASLQIVDNVARKFVSSLVR